MKIKFNTLFFLAALRQKQRFEAAAEAGTGARAGIGVASLDGSSDDLFLSDNDLQWLIEDMLFFINYYTINPAANFIKNYFAYLFS